MFKNTPADTTPESLAALTLITLLATPVGAETELPRRRMLKLSSGHGQ
jgi:hypothetical protein